MVLLFVWKLKVNQKGAHFKSKVSLSFSIPAKVLADY